VINRLDVKPETPLSHYKPAILITLVALGVFLQLSGLVDYEQMILLSRKYADQWWLAVLLVLIQTVMFTFATAGSSMIWITGVLFTPATSTLVITAGTTLGGISAYVFSAHLSEEWVTRVEQSGIYRLLQKESGFLILFALRLMPGFPHSVINYSGGILKIRLAVFIASAILGTAAKTYVYSVLLYNATSPGKVTAAIDLSTVWPLLAFSLLILSSVLLKRLLRKK
jgi:uncharacterized membrane protein YdjX (TVP38/TMEM64 family)